MAQLGLQIGQQIGFDTSQLSLSWDQRQTNMFPWLNQKQSKWVIDKTKDIKDPKEKLRMQNEIYQQVLPRVQQNKQLQDGSNNQRELEYRASNAKDSEEKAVLKIQSRVTSLANTIRDKAPWPINMSDDELVENFVNSVPRGEQLFMDYVNGKNENLLTDTGLKTVSKFKQELQKMWKSALDVTAPARWLLQGLSDVSQGIIWKPIEFLAKSTLPSVARLFGASDEQIQKWIDNMIWSTQSDITGWWQESFEKTWDISQEIGRFLWSIALTWGISLPKISGTWLALLKSVLSKTAVGAAIGALDTIAYNLSASDGVGEPVNIWLGSWLWAAISWPWALLWARIVWPWIEKLATKLQLSWLLNRSRLDRLQTILRQSGNERLANATPEDVASRMFQRDIKGSKEWIIDQLRWVAWWARDILRSVLSRGTAKYKDDSINSILTKVVDELDRWSSKQYQNAAQEARSLLSRAQDEWLTLNELQDVKSMIDKYLDPYKVSWDAKVSKQDIANIRSEIRSIIENWAEQEWLIGDLWMWVRELNNEIAMARSMEEAITQKLWSDLAWEILSFVSNKWGTTMAWWLLWSEVWPFDSNTIGGKLGNIVVGWLLGRFMWSTKAKTTTASWLKSLSWPTKARIWELMNKNVDELTDRNRNYLNKWLNKLIWDTDETLQYTDDEILGQTSNVLQDSADTVRANNGMTPAWLPTKSDDIVPPKTMDAKINDPVVRVEWPQISDDLLEEARKYKSADEFIESSKLYRWGEIWDDMFATPRKELAEGYAKWWKVNEMFIDRSDVDFYLPTKHKEYKELVIDKYYDLLELEWDMWLFDNAIYKRYKKMLETWKLDDAFNRYDIEPNIDNLYEFLEKQIRDYAQFDYRQLAYQDMDWIQPLLESVVKEKTGKSIIARPYDIEWEGAFMKFMDDAELMKEWDFEYIIWDSSKLKTETQLREIREQANQ